MALHYKQPNISAILFNMPLSSNAFKSLIAIESHDFVFHISFLATLELTTEVGVARTIARHHDFFTRLGLLLILELFENNGFVS
jgi:hypothetical protein